jgi:hypothetical protein
MSKLLDFHGQFWPLAVICQVKRHDEGQRKEIYYTVQDMSKEEAK